MTLCRDVVIIYHSKYTCGTKIILCRDVVIIYHSKYTCGEKKMTISTPRELNDYRPVALTSVPFKCLERIILKHLKSETELSLDDAQYAYRKNKCTEDATIILTHSVIEHLEKPNSYARASFIDFSSAFNTILPTLLIEQLASSGVCRVSSTLRKFILDFLTGRHLRVRMGHHLSSFIIINTGAPRGCVLSAYLFIIHTNLLRSLFPNCRVYKYADDTVIIG